MQQVPTWKRALVMWLGIYPTITTVFYFLSPFIQHFPLLLKTLCLTLCVVPLMNWLILPFLQKILRGWLMG
jgi:uncharacterized protein